MSTFLPFLFKKILKLEVLRWPAYQLNVFLKVVALFVRATKKVIRLLRLILLRSLSYVLLWLVFHIIFHIFFITTNDGKIFSNPVHYCVSANLLLDIFRNVLCCVLCSVISNEQSYNTNASPKVNFPQVRWSRSGYQIKKHWQANLHYVTTCDFYFFLNFDHARLCLAPFCNFLSKICSLLHCQ